MLAEALFEGEIEGICRKVIEEAKQGNIQAIKIVLDRILPTKKEALIFIDLPVLKTAPDILEAVSRVAEAVCHGKILNRWFESSACAYPAENQELRK